MERIKAPFGKALRDVPGWVWLAVVLVAFYALRHYPTLSQRILMWDDFVLLSTVATVPHFLERVLYTFLHFVPFLHLAMFSFMQLPMSWLLPVTSLWTVFWVAWLAVAFFRLARIYGIAPVPALLGIAFIVFNPMFAEVQIWLTSTFYLVALVFTVEGVVQLEQALRTNRTRHWIAAAVFSLLAPCAWSTGYITALFYVIILAWGWRDLQQRRAALSVAAFAFLAYPALRLLGEYLAGHTYLEVTPWTIPQLFLAVLKIIGDSLILGSLGLWRMPHKNVTYPAWLLISLTMSLGTAFLFMYWRWPQWRKQIFLGATAIVVAVAIPIYFRGSHFPYDFFRWFIRYYTTPLFGLGLVIALAMHQALPHMRHARRYLTAAFAVILVVSFVNKMPEHYVGAGFYKNRIRAQQVAQLEVLDQVFAEARRQGVGLQPLIDTIFVPVEGAQTNFNGAGFYTGYREPNHAPVSPVAHQALVRVIRDARSWESYRKLTFTPAVSTTILAPKGNDVNRISLLASPTGISNDFRPIKVAQRPHVSQEFTITGNSPSVTYAIPPNSPAIDRIVTDIEMPGRTVVRLQVTLSKENAPSGYRSSMFVWCDEPRCRFDIPISHFLWVPPWSYSMLRIDFPKLEANEAPQRVIIRSLFLVPDKDSNLSLQTTNRGH